MTYCKLTDENGQSFGGTQWGAGVTHAATGAGGRLCSPDVIHIYDSPLKAVFMNPAHADFSHPRLWLAKVSGIVANDGTKVGVKSCTTIKELPLPVLTTEQRVEVAIKMSLLVYKQPNYITWAQNWLNGRDRNAESAWAAAESAVKSAAESARSAARSAWSAARSATESAVQSAAESAGSAAKSASWSAGSADFGKRFNRILRSVYRKELTK